MSASCLANRLGDMVVLTANEIRALVRLEERDRTVRRGVTGRKRLQRRPFGAAQRHDDKLGAAPLRQPAILRFHFPGDMQAVSALLYREASERITALSDCIACPFERATFSALIVDHPRIAAFIMVYNQIERTALTDRLAALGRTSAKARVAAVLIELRNRMRMLDKTIGARFTLGLTQEEIGDATGLTAVHVNRCCAIWRKTT